MSEWGVNSTSLKMLACNRVYLNLVSYLIKFLKTWHIYVGCTSEATPWAQRTEPKVCLDEDMLSFFLQFPRHTLRHGALICIMHALLMAKFTFGVSLLKTHTFLWFQSVQMPRMIRELSTFTTMPCTWSLTFLHHSMIFYSIHQLWSELLRLTCPSNQN